MSVSRWGILSLVSILAACADSPMLQNVPDKGAGRPALLPYTVKVVPVPRIGLFNDLFWTSATQYRNALSGPYANGETRLLDPKVAGMPGVDWDPILSVTSHRGRADVEAIARTRLQSRQLRITISAPEPWKDCTLRIDHPQYAQPIPCGDAPDKPDARGFYEASHVAYYHFNDRRDFSITVRGAGGDRTLPGHVPADELFVAIGDSYMSGEGNPDRPIRGSSWSYGQLHDAEAKLAWWMDRRCHRSMWSWPAQLALKYSREAPPQPDAANGTVLVVHRGISMVSVACSGAEVNEGVISEWRGREPFDRMLGLHDDIEVDGKIFGYEFLLRRKGLAEFQQRRVEKQIEEAKHIVAGRPIDVLLLSVGGNDINFAGVILDFLVRWEKTIKGEEMREQFASNFKGLTDEYGKLANEVNAPNFDPKRTLIAQYPDPTWRKPGEPCDGFFAITNYSKEKMILVRTLVLEPLNKLIEQAASQYGWTALGIDQTPFQSHGWCNGGENAPYHPEGKRWFRKLDESRELQGTLPGNPIISSGTMHPTHLAHAELARQVAKRLEEQRLTFSLERSDGTLEPLSGHGAALPLSGELRVHISGDVLPPPLGDSTVDYRTTYPEFRISGGSWTSCTNGACVLSNAPGATRLSIKLTALGANLKQGTQTLELRARSVNLARQHSAPIRLFIDTERPVVADPGHGWASGPREVTVYATDDGGSGIAAWRVQDAAGNPRACRSEQAATSSTAARCVVAFAAPGEVLRVAAIDRAGNDSLVRDVPALIDNVPPAADAVVIAGVTLPLAGRKIAWLRDGRADVEVRASDAGSGLSRFDLSHPAGSAVACAQPGEDRRCIGIRAPAGPLAEPPKLSLADKAQLGTETRIDGVELVALPAQPGRQRTVSYWKGRILRDAGTTRIDAVQALRGRPAGKPDAANDEEWVAVAVWLNMLEDAREPESAVGNGSCGRNAINAGLNPADIPATFYGLALALDKGGADPRLVRLARCLVGG